MRVHQEARALALVAHPHPRYGGTLHNPVIFHTDRALHRLGLTTLRFNFRGVGTSDGEHDQGPGEVEDLAAAAAWLRGLAPRLPLLLVGYSFGAVCAVRHGSSGGELAGLIGIGLPLRLYPLPEIDKLEAPLAVIQGGEDEFGSPEEVREALAGTRPEGRLYVIEGSRHLFPGQAETVGRLAAGAAEDLLG